jgi:predicted phage terminase large subunit-like protein
VKRSQNPKESTVEAWGLVKGPATGRHFKLIVYDDVVTPESVTTPEMIKKTTDAWRDSLNMVSKEFRIRMIGTRYHAADTYAEIIKAGNVAPRIYPATDDGTFEGNPVFFSRESLAEKRREMGPYIFGCQMLQDPKADAVAGFREEWLRYWEPKDWGGMNVYILVDPAGEKKKGSDYTVMWVVGLAADLNYYLIDGLRDRLNLTQRARALIRLHRQYRPRAVGYEKYGIQADVEHVRYVQDQENYRFEITELGGSMPKNDRIRRLIPSFEQGRFYIPGHLSFRDAEGSFRNLTEEFIREEFLPFPVAAHDDMLDCLARIVDPDLDAIFPMGVSLAARFPAGPDLAVTEWNPWS